MANEFTLVENAQNGVANTIETIYPATDNTIITTFTATNNTGVNRSYRAYIYDSSGNVTGATVPLKFVTSNRGYDLAPAIVGHIIPSGGSLRVESSAASSIQFRVTGRTV
jgi:hypothetical protein